MIINEQGNITLDNEESININEFVESLQFDIKAFKLNMLQLKYFSKTEKEWVIIFLNWMEWQSVKT